ncbi:hypothetical protein [Flavobacterium sp.]
MVFHFGFSVNEDLPSVGQDGISASIYKASLSKDKPSVIQEIISVDHN